MATQLKYAATATYTSEFFSEEEATSSLKPQSAIRLQAGSLICKLPASGMSLNWLIRSHHGGQNQGRIKSFCQPQAWPGFGCKNL